MTLSIFKPLLAITLRASLLEGKILFSATKSKIFIPFFISSEWIFISGKSEPYPPPSNVSFAVCSAFFDAFSPWSNFVASLANKIFKLFIFFSLLQIISISFDSNCVKKENL